MFARQFRIYDLRLYRWRSSDVCRGSVKNMLLVPYDLYVVLLDGIESVSTYCRLIYSFTRLGIVT